MNTLHKKRKQLHLIYSSNIHYYVILLSIQLPFLLLRIYNSHFHRIKWAEVCFYAYSHFYFFGKHSFFISNHMPCSIFLPAFKNFQIHCPIFGNIQTRNTNVSLCSTFSLFMVFRKLIFSQIFLVASKFGQIIWAVSKEHCVICIPKYTHIHFCNPHTSDISTSIPE